MIIDIIGLLEVVLAGAEIIGAAAEIIDAISDAIALLGIATEPAYADLTLAEKTDILKRCTKIVANLGLEISCYPLGYATTVLFDLDGNPVP